MPTGAQDYYPAMYGGVSAIELTPAGIARKAIPVDLRDLNARIVLAYTGEPRNSGVNNWEVTKAHSDGDAKVHRNFDRLASIAHAMRGALERADWDDVARLLREEWSNRRKNAPGITTPLIDRLVSTTRRAGAAGAKVCGAGGGGCVIFLVEPGSKAAVSAVIEREGRNRAARQHRPARSAHSENSMDGPTNKAGVYLRVAVYIVLYGVSVFLLAGLVVLLGGYFFGVTLSQVVCAVFANWVSLRMYTSLRVVDLGLRWNRDAARNLALGLAGGIGAATLVLAPPLAAHLARLGPARDAQATWDTFLFTAVLLLIGSAGEELLFRGYGFQMLFRVWGPNTTVFTVGALFAALHGANPNSTWLGLLNTAGLRHSVRIRFSAQRRSVAAHRTSLRLEFHTSPLRRQRQWAYN